MRVLVACEYSGVVRNAFRDRGHDAWSCDLLDSEDASAFHVVGDVSAMLKEPWDLVIAHPPCTFLANSSSKHLYLGMKKENGIDPERWENMRLGAEFYVACWNANSPKIAVENPIMHGHAASLIKSLAPDHPDKRQIVQPWWFGHTEVKATGLALKNLPALTKTNDVKEATFALDYKERAKVHYASPGPDRWKDRSRTLKGLADAMAEQWKGEYV